MGEHRFVVFDRLSRNQLGEFRTIDAAEECLLRFVRAEPDAAKHLEIWDDDRDEILGVDPAKIAAATAT